jgi:hypothetical protein
MLYFSFLLLQLSMHTTTLLELPKLVQKLLVFIKQRMVLDEGLTQQMS